MLFNLDVTEMSHHVMLWCLCAAYLISAEPVVPEHGVAEGNVTAWPRI